MVLSIALWQFLSSFLATAAANCATWPATDEEWDFLLLLAGTDCEVPTTSVSCKACLEAFACQGVAILED